MNERIRECWLKSAREDSDDKWHTQEEFAELFIERFARLIVQECANIFEGVYTDQQRPERIDKRIKEHFGVE